VTGEAVDVEAASGIAWLEKNGVRFGLCRKYANEDWHFELLAPTVGSSCPPMLPHARGAWPKTRRLTRLTCA